MKETFFGFDTENKVLNIKFNQGFKFHLLPYYFSMMYQYMLMVACMQPLLLLPKPESLRIRAARLVLKLFSIRSSPKKLGDDLRLNL